MTAGMILLQRVPIKVSFKLRDGSSMSIMNGFGF